MCVRKSTPPEVNVRSMTIYSQWYLPPPRYQVVDWILETRSPGARLLCNNQPLKIFADVTKPRKFFHVNYENFPIYGSYCISSLNRCFYFLISKLKTVLTQLRIFLSSVTITLEFETALAVWYALQKLLGYFNRIFRLSQFHQCDQGMLPNEFV